jgi:hypothetical protein
MSRAALQLFPVFLVLPSLYTVGIMLTRVISATGRVDLTPIPRTVRKAIHQALASGIPYWFSGRTEGAIILQFT